MKEIRIHGRGGQGAVTAGIILAQSLFNSGKYVQTFPIFGVERRGAPVAAFVRVGESEILQRYNVYTPDDVIVLDTALIDVVNVFDGLKKDGNVLLNAPAPPVLQTTHEIITLDAKEIAWEHGLGSKQAPVVNTIMVGAYLALIEIDSEYGLRAVEKHVPDKLQANKEAFIDGYRAVADRGKLI